MISRQPSMGKLLATAFLLPVASAAGVFAAQRLRWSLHEKFCPKFEEEDEDDDVEVAVAIPLKAETTEEFRELVKETLREFARPELDIIAEASAEEAARREKVVEMMRKTEKSETETTAQS